ncbi:hypothetical protein J4G37_36885, partial [Microvirga sp. 3-52]|nr:hypothetical protein [Microvirga sp. 3-52]
IDRHLTNGGRSIPKYLLLGKDGAVAAEWGPRASQLGDYVLKLKESLPSKDSTDYHEKQNEFISRITAEYTTKPEYWLAVYEDIRKTFLPVVQNV